MNHRRYAIFISVRGGHEIRGGESVTQDSFRDFFNYLNTTDNGVFEPRRRKSLELQIK
jgi:hypothetical protein